MSSDRRCDGCVFYDRHPTQLGAGRCLFGPPTPVLTGQGVVSLFPLVPADCWCFRWQAPQQGDGALQGAPQGRILTGN